MINFPALSRTLVGVFGALFLAAGFIGAATGPASSPATHQTATLSA